MSWPDGFSPARRRPNRVHPAQAVSPVFLPSGTSPSWVGGTAAYRALDDKDLSTLREMPAPPGILAPEGGPLPERSPSWLTRQGDEVGIGDLVALSVLNFPDAKGRIVGAANDGRVECVLGDHDDPHGTRPRLCVEVDNLVMLLRRAASAWGEPVDTKRLPKML